MKSLFTYGTLALAFTSAFVLAQKPPPVFVETLNSDQYGYHKGDVRIKLPPKAAQQLSDAIRKLGGHAQCPNPQAKRQDPPNAVARQAMLAAITQAVLPLAIPGALLNGFGLENAIALPNFRNPIVQARIIALQAWASCQAIYSRINPQLLNNLVKLVYVTVRDFCDATTQQLEEILEQEGVVWILLVDIDLDKNDDNDDRCPAKKSESSVCENCGGNDSKRCTTGPYKDCSCLDYAVGYSYPGNRRDLEKAQVVMANMIKEDWPAVRKTDGGDLQCGAAYDQGNANYFAALDTMNQAAAFFCKQMVDQNIKFEAKKPADIHELHYNNHNWDPIYVAVEWQPGDPGAQPMTFGTTNFLVKSNALRICNQRLSTIINGCDPSRNDKLYWKQGGTFYRGGMKWHIKRDTWSRGEVPSDPAWNPRVFGCQQDDDCNRTVWPCQGTCQKDDRYSDVGFCPCV